jgi:hypothetical protein
MNLRNLHQATALYHTLPIRVYMLHAAMRTPRCQQQRAARAWVIIVLGPAGPGTDTAIARAQHRSARGLLPAVLLTVQRTNTSSLSKAEADVAVELLAQGTEVPQVLGLRWALTWPSSLRALQKRNTHVSLGCQIWRRPRGLSVTLT